MNSKILFSICFMSFFPLISIGQNVSGKTIFVGENSILIPQPAKDFFEATDEIKAEAKLFIVPNSNKLLALYTLRDGDLSRKMCIQVSKSLEPYDINEIRFNEFKESIKPFMSKSLTDVLSELNNHLMTIEDIVGKINFGETQMIATLFEDANSVAFLMVTKVNTSNETVNLLSGMSSIRVKNKIIFAYVFDFLKNVESIKWVSSETNSWTKSILNANK